MPTDPSAQLFPIRELVRRTGVNASTLRAWENRHGLLAPTRTPSSHRLYGPADVSRVRRLHALLNQGLSLAEIAPLLEKETAPTQTGPQADAHLPDTLPITSAWQGYLAETLRALEDFNTERLDNLYSEACALYPIDLVTESLLIPVLEELGKRWDRRPSGIAEEHFFSAWLRNKLGARLHHGAGLPRGGQLIMACLPNENHEIGLLIFALASLQRGFRVIYLGANMPTRQIVHVARHTHALGIVLAGRRVETPEKILGDIAWLAEQCTAPVFVGSHFSIQAADALLHEGAVPLGDNLLQGLRVMEARLRAHDRVHR